MKKEVHKTQLLIFYKFINELSAETGFNGELEIGLPNKEFQRLKIENFAFMNKADGRSLEEFNNLQEFQFNTGPGILTIYNKDQ